VVVGSLEGDVIALDAATGAEKWKAEVANEVLVAPAVGNGMVFVHSNDGRVTALDAASGERRWFYSADVPALTVRGNGAMTVGPGLVFVGNDNGTVTALSMSDGGVLWTTPVAQPDGRSELERMADVDGPPVLDNTTLYATSYKNHTVAIDGPSGQLMWDRENGGPRGLGVSNSAVVVTDPTGKVWGLDKNSGGSLWQQDGLAYRNTSAPAVQGDYAVVGDLEGVVHWLRLSDGAFAARATLGGAISGQPAVADGIVVVQTTEGELAAFALQ
jgi:outer membrane protein assembly factor BamB